MASLADFIAANPGAYAGWGAAEAQADFNATGGAGKGNNGGGGDTGGGGGGNAQGSNPVGFTPINPSDITDLENQIFNAVKPYYTQLLTEAQGDMNRAVALLHQDYATGVRQKQADYTTGLQTELGNLKNTLGSLGISFTNEQLSAIDKLNERGLGVYQQSANGQPNALQMTLPHQGDTNPASADINNINPAQPGSLYYNADNSGILPTLQNLPNGANLGEGGVELQRTLQDQQLRQEAAQRASNSKLQTLGMTLRNYTNPQGQDFSTPASTNAAAKNTSVNPNFYGTAEQNLLSGTAQDTRNYQSTAENLYNQLQQNTLNEATSLAGVGVKQAGAITGNLANTTQEQNFVNQGTGTPGAT